MSLPIFWRPARQGLWQVLPLGPPATGNSPYSSTSAFAGNPLLISLERLAEHGWMDASQLAGLAARGMAQSTMRKCFSASCR